MVGESTRINVKIAVAPGRETWPEHRRVQQGSPRRKQSGEKILLAPPISTNLWMKHLEARLRPRKRPRRRSIRRRVRRSAERHLVVVAIGLFCQWTRHMSHIMVPTFSTVDVYHHFDPFTTAGTESAAERQIPIKRGKRSPGLCLSHPTATNMVIQK